ncbi:MAG: chromosome segregation protein SMC [Gammaproteobacteria bacterium]|nr:chromosome segregation protein SMC [Gammaproteobacteria bacterium]
MQLTNIKLTGFKSFVDPTSIPIRKQMTSIVGPNGCGKSNVVDAIRWVVGESSAKQLRGQSMTDVIFNGTSARKPIGKASVELVFSNNAGRLVGEYAKFTEISVKREVDRDAQSRYYVNGVQCRRRDIRDIFLGTGLGPRSYAIIEQGMISRLIEAKPEEVRVYLEEAAGISKYKERRRETENRIRHTQENLDRLSDLREEMEKQLRHLKRQANAAERYKVLKQEERLLQAQIKVLNWQVLADQVQAMRQDLQQREVSCDQLQTNIRSFETEVEAARLRQVEATEQQNAVQKQYYSLGADIARIEQSIEHSGQQVEQWQQELEETATRWQELNDQSYEQTSQLEDLTSELESLTPQNYTLQADLDVATQGFHKAQAAMQVWQKQWDEQQTSFFDLKQKLSVLQNNLQHNTQQSGQQKARYQHLTNELNSTDLNALNAEVMPLTNKAEQLQTDLLQEQVKLGELNQQITDQRQQNTRYQENVLRLHQNAQELIATRASLTALQQAALGDNDESVNAWLDVAQLTDKPRLGQNLQVESGWEQAVEMVLGSDFSAVCVDQVAPYFSALKDLSAGQVTLTSLPTVTNIKANSLASKVSGPYAYHPKLANIYLADSLASAEQQLTQLADNESIIVKEGIWLGKNWVKVSKALSETDSVLHREQEIKRVNQELEAAEADLATQQELLAEGAAKLDDLEQKRSQAQQDYQSFSNRYTEAQTELSATQSRLAELTQQQQRNQQAASVANNEIESLQQTAENINQEINALQTEIAQQSEATTELQNRRAACENALEQARQKAQAERQKHDELEIRLSSNQSQVALLKQTLSGNERQLEKITERRELLEKNLAASDEPLNQLKTELQDKLNSRLEVETNLREVESQLQQHNQRLETLTQQIHDTAEKLQQAKDNLQTARLEEQALIVRQATIKEQIDESHFNLEELQAEIPEEAELTAWQEQADTLALKISRLGAINLAAIDEYDALAERKEYLDKQHIDLEQALELLQNAIRRIDKETRARFRDVFDRVNSAMQQIFPRIFGGGRASLELLEDDILKTGIIIRAQPPGKRNASIHMLSGGEKALTAIAFVFAMFQLNPAPFCILDEVDAPLDDVNVGRFCKLVREMSDCTQFIVISHNKVTIEAADSLMGVTMQEPGVSRIVSVDMEAAVEMAAA